MSILSNLLPKPKAKRATVEFCPGVTVDGYRLLRTDEFRVGIYGASLVLGYAENWLYRVMGSSQSTYQKRDKTLETLNQWGFSNLPGDVEIVNMGEGRGRNWATTISLTDFNCLIGYAAIACFFLPLIGAVKLVKLRDTDRGCLNIPVISR